MANKKDLPHNSEAEKAVLGAMLRSKEKLSDGLAKLVDEDFFEENENHRAIFNAMLRLNDKGIPCDPQTVINELINTKELELAGGPEYLIELSDAVITFTNFDSYVNIVQEQAVLRTFLKTIANISNDYYTKDIENIGDFLSLSEKKITAVTEKRKIGDFQKSQDITSELAKEFEKLKATDSDDKVTGVATGYSRLNVLTHGFQPGELIILAARPGIGKTALSLNLALNAALNGHAVAYFSLEMPASTLFKRLISADSGVPFESLITGYNVDQKTRVALKQSCDRLGKEARIFVDDTSGIKILDLVAKCKKLAASEPDLKLIIVDYIGLVNAVSKKADSRQLEVQMVSQTLKKLALELKLPIIGVAQLNRKVEERGGEPQLSDLRESGSIEQDADIVMLLHETNLDSENGDPKGKNVFEKQNAAVNQAQQEVVKKEPGAGPDTKLVTIIVAKNRSGKQGKVPLVFRRNYCKFTSPSKEGADQIVALESERISYFAKD